MDQSRGWGPQRWCTLGAVLAFHIAVLAALMTAPRSSQLSESSNPPIEVMFLPPPSAAKVRANNFQPRRLSGDTAISIAPPVLAADSALLSPDASAADGNGTGVDWKAEARRALQAIEIRNRNPSSEYVMPISPAEETWWPPARRHSGSRFKTASGDWVVWINSHCYQIATSAANAAALGEILPETVCMGDKRERPTE